MNRGAVRSTLQAQRSSPSTAASQRPIGMAVTQVRGGGGGGDGPRAFISPQACSRIRLDHARLRSTISSAWLGDFSYSAFALRTFVALVAAPDSAAHFAAQMTGAGEQPGRGRPHPPTP
jgi:hypothetical protein